MDLEKKIIYVRTSLAEHEIGSLKVNFESAKKKTIMSANTICDVAAHL